MSTEDSSRNGASDTVEKKQLLEQTEKQLEDLKAQLRKVEQHQAQLLEKMSVSNKPKAGSSAGKKYQFLLCVVLGVVLSWAFEPGWQKFNAVYSDFVDSYSGFYYQRIHLLYMRNMSMVEKMLMARLPLVDETVRDWLKADGKSHVAYSDYYDPDKHDKVYRALRQNVVTEQECAVVRDLVKRISLWQGDFEDHDSLNQEFQRRSIFELLDLVKSDDTAVRLSLEEKRLLSDILERVQKAVNDHFKSDTLLMEYGDITVRQCPIDNNFLGKWHYMSRGGHQVHSDQCTTASNKATWFRKFDCKFDYDHCCPHRMYSVLLYLSDPNEVKGGDLYLVDRQDLSNETEPSYSGAGLKTLMGHTVRVKPTCGNLVMFASDARNLHGTYPIEKGERYAFTIWFNDPRNMPWLKPEVAAWDFAEFLNLLERRCVHLGKELPVPPGLQDQVGNCSAFMDKVKQMSHWDEHKDVVLK